MKIARIARVILLIVLFSLALTVMSGCAVTPHKEEWYFFSYKQDFTFMNGVTLNLGFSDASHVYPFVGAGDVNIGISFSKDGKVEFTPLDGVTLYGTYTQDKNTSHTSFTITFDNGEVVEGTSMKKDGKRLALTYKGVIYTFTTENQRSNVTMDAIVAKILDGDYGPLHQAEVVKGSDYFAVQYSDYVNYPIKSSTAVYAMRIHKDGSYEILNEIFEGPVLSIYANAADYVILYYLD